MLPPIILLGEESIVEPLKFSSQAGACRCSQYEVISYSNSGFDQGQKNISFFSERIFL